MSIFYHKKYNIFLVLFTCILLPSIMVSSIENTQDVNISSSKELSEIKPLYESKYIYEDSLDVNPSIVTNMGLNNLHSMGLSGKNVTIAVLDSGVDMNDTRFDVDGNAFTTDDKRIKISKSFVSGEDSKDYKGHGTMVIGLISASETTNGGFSMSGIAKDADIWNLKVLDADGDGDSESIISALNYVLDHKEEVDIISMSLGNAFTRMENIEEKVIECWNAGIIVCIAAGNEGGDENTGDAIFYTVNSPASALEPIAVGATYNEDYLATYSSNGPTTDLGYFKPEVVIPGTNIVSVAINSALGESSGTSLSTPILSGSLALVLEALPFKPSADLIKSALLDSCTSLGYDTPYLEGAGLPDFYNMLQLLQNNSYDRITILPSHLSFPNMFDTEYESSSMYDYDYMKATVVVGKNITDDIDIVVSENILKYIKIIKDQPINKKGQFILGIDFIQKSFQFNMNGEYNGTIDLIYNNNIVAQINVNIEITLKAFFKSTLVYLILITLLLTSVAIISFKNIISHKPTLTKTPKICLEEGMCECNIDGTYCHVKGNK